MNAAVTDDTAPTRTPRSESAIVTSTVVSP